MRRQLLWLVAGMAVVASCADTGGTEPQQFDVPLLVESAGGHTDAHGAFKTHLTGAEEVPSNPSRGQGQANFRLSRDGTELHYRLIVANITNVTQAHIHLAPFGQNGPVVVWLYPSGPPAVQIPGRTQGVLAEGTITESNFVGQLAGQPFSSLLAHIRNGNAYVNVHTTQLPPGEIRGQID